jgi:hypothetical protein
VNVPDTVRLIETNGATFRLYGGSVHVWYPHEGCRKELTKQVAYLRDHRTEVAAFLESRNPVPNMPACMRLMEWNLKRPPVAIESFAVVTDPGLFARTTLEQLRIALAVPKRSVGWTIPQLIERLAQVGVRVTLESAPQENFLNIRNG